MPLLMILLMVFKLKDEAAMGERSLRIRTVLVECYRHETRWWYELRFCGGDGGFCLTCGCRLGISLYRRLLFVLAYTMTIDRNWSFFNIKLFRLYF